MPVVLAITCDDEMDFASETGEEMVCRRHPLILFFIATSELNHLCAKFIFPVFFLSIIGILEDKAN